MSWFDNVGKIAKSVYDFTGIPGLIHDVSTAGSNEDPWYVDAVNVAKDAVKVGTTPLRGAVKGLFALGEASYNVGQTARTGIVGAELKLPFMYNRYKKIGESYDDYVKRVDAEKDQITLGQATLSLLSPGKNAAENSGWFKDFTDNHAQFLSAGFDIFNPEDRKAAFEDQNIGKFITGTTDLAAVTFIDPLFVAGVAGKGLSIAARAPMYTSLTGAGETGIKAIPGSLTRAVFGRMAMTTDSMDDLLGQALKGEGRALQDIEFLASTKTAKEQYGYWQAKKVTHPDAMAFLFSRANSKEEVVATFRAIIGKDTKAMAAIAEKDPEAALLLDNMGELSKPYRDALTGRLDGDLVVDDAYNGAIDTFVSRLATEDDRYRIALEKVATGGNEFKGGTFARGPLAGTARKRAEKYAATYAEPDTTIIQATGLHPTVAIVNHAAKGVKDFFGQFRPSGVYQVNDGDSYREFNAFLREANELTNGEFRGTAASLADKYLNAATEGERLNIIQQAERAAVAAIAPGMSQREIDYIYTMYDYRRAKAIQEHKNRGFVSLFTDNGPVVAKLPVLERESANVVIAMDLRKLKNGIERFEGVLPGVLSGIDATDITMRSKKFLDTLDTVNDIFKTSVLLRLGYTVRNLGEAQLSLLAKGFALPAVVASGGKDAVARFVNNRKAGFTRAIDHVNILAGRADDVNVMRQEVARLTDQLRALGMSREQLAREVRQRIAEFERGTFRPRIVETEYGGMGPLTAEDELKVLREALEELDSATLYHGTADTGFALDRTRALATSASPGTADKYTRVAVTRSVADYMQTPSGRAVKLGNTEATIKNAQQAIKDAEKQIAMAEKEIARSGSTQFDVPLLKQTVEENKVLLKKSKAKLRSAEKRAESIGEAADNLISDMVDAIGAGRIVEMQVGNRWRRVEALNWNQIRLAEEGALEMKPETLENLVFRVRGKLGDVVPVKAYGPALDMTNWASIPVELRQSLFNNNITQWRAWNKSKGWQDNQSALFAYLRENGYGRAIVADDVRAAGKSHIVLPEAIGEQGRLRAVRETTRRMETEGAAKATEELDLPQAFDTPKARRDARRKARQAEKSRRKHPAVSPYYDRESITAMVNNGVQDAATKLGEDFATIHAQLDDVMSRLNARIGAAESMRVKQRLGYGYFQYDVGGHTYEVPEAYQGASWFWSRTSAEPTFNALVGSQQMAFMTGAGARSMRPVKPNDPRYFEAWSGVLNMHFRDPETGIMDPVVRMILDGRTDDEVVKWLTQSRAGRMYANNTYTTPGQAVGFGKMKAGELDDYIGRRVSDTRQAVRLYIPDEDTAALLSAADEAGLPLTGAQIEEFLMNRFGSNPENLPEINGLLITTSKEYRDQERIIDTINRRVMRFLGSLPEDTFARHPLASAVYKDNVKKNIAGIAAAKGSERLTVDELNRAQSAAREEARREVERTLFTIVRRTGASSSQVMRLLFPFYAAYENTLYRWTGIIGENPAALTTAARTIADIVHGMDVVDREGNPVKDASSITGDENLIVQVPQAFINSLPGAWKDVMQNAFKSISIPLASLDVVTQGQPGNPGFGPYAVLPAYLVLRQRPEFEETFKALFPAGMPTNASDIFLPSALRRMKTMWTQDAQYVRTFNQMLRYETYNYNSGKRQEPPTADEIQDKTNKFFILRTLTAISAPFAISPEVDFYQQQYKQFQRQYPNPGEADAKFLEMYPDFFEATVSLSKNIGGLEASQQTVKNLRKFSNLMSIAEAKGDPELMGWLANDFDGKYDFSQAAYQWQYRHGAYPGSASTYRQNRNPNELIRDANLKRGWTEYRKLQDEIDAFKIQNGITSNRDPLLDQYNLVKRAWLDIMAKENSDWYAAYMSPDRGKYMRRAEILKQAFKDDKWLAQNGDRPVVKAVALYLNTRDQIGQELLARDQMGGSRSLDANSNEDIQAMWDGFVTQLKAESPEFGDFINRYFPNDPVVL